MRSHPHHRGMVHHGAVEKGCQRRFYHFPVLTYWESALRAKQKLRSSGHGRQFAALLEKLTHEMRVWYNSGLNIACIAEVRALLAALLEDDTAEDEEDANE